MYEHRTHSLLTWPKFLVRAARHLVWSLMTILGAVGIGTLGYRVAGRLSWALS